MNKKQLILLIVGLLLIIGGVLAFNTYNKIYKPNTIKEGFVYIKTNSTLKDVENELRPFLKRVQPFVWVAKRKKYGNVIRAGKFKIPKGISNNDLINLLRGGKQTPVKLVFNNQHRLENLAGRIATQIEADSVSILNAMQDKSFLSHNGFSETLAVSFCTIEAKAITLVFERLRLLACSVLLAFQKRLYSFNIRSLNCSAEVFQYNS